MYVHNYHDVLNSAYKELLVFMPEGKTVSYGVHEESEGKYFVSLRKKGLGQTLSLVLCANKVKSDLESYNLQAAWICSG